MEHAMVSVATGVLSPTLGKLSTLLEKKYNSLKGVHDDIISLKDELSSMNALLLKLADMSDLDVQLKEWRNQIRELSYDIEDCIDDFTHHADRGHSRPHDMKGFFQDSIHKLRTLGARNEIANQILKLKARVDDASERRHRYNFDGAASSSSSVVPIDPRLPALYAEAESLVGIDEPREELIKWLTEGEGMSEQRLKVVSVVGLGGLGKTTLARQVYDKIGGQFDCQAFVSVSQKSDMRKIFRDMLKDVTGMKHKPDKRKIFRDMLKDVTGMKHYPDIEACDEEQLIDILREFLTGERYFIVIDDIWSTLHWEIIRCALPGYNLGSRILTTTRIISVAKSCCSPDYQNVCEMKRLSEVNAEKLFVKRVFGYEDQCPSQLKEVSKDILRKCGGLPLAILSIASLLASKPRTKEQWEMYGNSIGSSLVKIPSVDEMQKILSLSYNDLPHYLKTCLLYVSTFPEDFIIKRDLLVGRWIAEGFITTGEQNLEQVGECYFNELINRSLIQPLEIQYDGRVRACRVHDMILDLIVSKSIEENFVTLFGYRNNVLGAQDKVRRLSLDCRHQEDIMVPSTMVVSTARSLNIYGSAKHMPPLSGFQALRIINIENNYKLESHHFNDIRRLFHLKHLRLADVSITKLPEQIGELQQLERLVLKHTGIRALPKSFIRLKKLVFLRADNVSLPEGIGSMKALQKLSRMEVNSSITSTSLNELGCLIELRYLQINWCISDNYSDRKSYTESFVSSMCVLCRLKLRCLHIRCWRDGCSPDFLLDSWSPPPYCLQNLRFTACYYFPRLPEWVASLSSITFLDINITPLGEESLRALGDLPSLLYLKLWTETVAPKERGLFIFSSGFQCLKEFRFYNWNIAPLVFEVGAMPKLEKYVLWMLARETGYLCGDVDFCVQHIPSLKHLHANIDCRGARAREVEAAEAAVKNATDLLPNHIQTVEINRRYTWLMVKDEEAGRKDQGEGHMKHPEQEIRSN